MMLWKKKLMSMKLVPNASGTPSRETQAQIVLIPPCISGF